MRISVLAGFLTVILVARTAYAQGYPSAAAPAPMPQAQAQSLDQYPAFIEATSAAPDGSQIVTRCGYGVNGINIVSDPSFLEVSTLNESNKYYLQYQRINNNFLVTVPAPNIAGRFLIEALEPNGTTIAKNCQLNVNTDTVQNCMPAQPFMQASQIISQDQNGTGQCSALLTAMMPQINRTIYNNMKVQIFKGALQQKLSAIEAP